MDKEERRVAHETVPCPTCALLVPKGARKCTHCDSFLDWRRFVGASTTGLALLIALISVLTAAVPVITRSLAKHRPVVTGVVGSTSVEHLDSQLGTRQVISIILLLTNGGDEDALVANVWWLGERPDSTWQQVHFFSDIEMATKLLVPSKSPRALQCYIDTTYGDTLEVVVDYYGGGGTLFRSPNMIYDIAPAPPVATVDELLGFQSAAGFGPRPRRQECDPITLESGAIAHGASIATLRNVGQAEVRMDSWVLDDGVHDEQVLHGVLQAAEARQVTLTARGLEYVPGGGRLILRDPSGLAVCVGVYTDREYRVGQWQFRYFPPAAEPDRPPGGPVSSRQ